FLSTGPGGEILGYGTNGWVMAAVTLFGVFWVGQVVRPAPDAASRAAKPESTPRDEGPGDGQAHAMIGQRVATESATSGTIVNSSNTRYAEPPSALRKSPPVHEPP